MTLMKAGQCFMYLAILLMLPNFISVHPHVVLTLEAHPFVLDGAGLRVSPLYLDTAPPLWYGPSPWYGPILFRAGITKT